MDDQTLKALKASIAKWERNAKVETPDGFLFSPRDCPLCDLFYWRKHCGGCPVAERTGRGQCIGSPYVIASDKLLRWSNGKNNGDPARKAARAEVKFLKSLLPEGEST